MTTRRIPPVRRPEVGTTVQTRRFGDVVVQEVHAHGARLVVTEVSSLRLREIKRPDTGVWHVVADPAGVS
jgi:hypothetical protein